MRGLPQLSGNFGDFGDNSCFGPVVTEQFFGFNLGKLFTNNFLNFPTTIEVIKHREFMQ